MKVVAFFVCILLVLLISFPSSVPLGTPTADEILAQRGGLPDCYVDGEALCPQPTMVNKCSSKECDKNGLCPAGNKEPVQFRTKYDAVGLVPPLTPGHTGRATRPSVDCYSYYQCNGCTLQASMLVCIKTSTVDSTESRVPTVVDTSSPECP